MNTRVATCVVQPLLVAVLLAVPATAGAQRPPRPPILIDAGNANEALRDQLASARLVERNDMLMPCDPFSTLAFAEQRPSADGVWAGEFEVLAPASGNWFVVVEGEGAPWRQKVSKQGERFLTRAFAGSAVEILLEGPGTGPVCPRVRLRAELQGGRPATPRGVSGRDDRWHLTSTELQALPDSKTIASWASSIVHLQVFDARRGLPCTGFFITAHLVMTARHCVLTQMEATNTTMQFGATTIRGLQLLVSQADLDFSVLWVETNTTPPTLTLRPQTAAPLVLWQSPASSELLVSVVDCTTSPGTNHYFHKCDTSVGTSGAPIQNRADGSVVAVHTDGCTISGQPDCVNFGTPITDIRARLKDCLPLLEPHPAAAELRAVLQ
jgi:hypothetical protein